MGRRNERGRKKTVYFWISHRRFRPSIPQTHLINATLFQSSPLSCFLSKHMFPPSIKLDKSERYKSSCISLSFSSPFQGLLILSHRYFCLLFLLSTRQHLCSDDSELKLSDGSLYMHCCPLCSVLFPAVKRVNRLMGHSSA